MPLVRVSYTEKAPASASVEDIEEKLRTHYGKIYTDGALYQTEVLDQEKQLGKFGEKLCTITQKQGGKTFDLNKVCTDEETGGFQERQYYLQGLLTFFIDAASKVEVSPFWHYFLLYDNENGHIAGFVLFYQAHQSMDRIRSKIALFFVVPTYQKQGLGSKMYEAILNHCINDMPKCYQLIVEDAADSF